MVKNLPVKAGVAGVVDLIPVSKEIPLEKVMASHSVTIAWENQWTEELGGLKDLDTIEANEHSPNLTPY